MNYELAIKLKEAGFRQDTIFHWYPNGYSSTGETETRDPICANPSLEELIEACGMGFNTLKLVERYFASGEKVFGASGSIGDGSLEESYGKTPSDAVANLWLELKKAKKNCCPVSND